MRFPSILGAALSLLLATATLADEAARARIAGVAGSERLRLFAYGKLLDTGQAPRRAFAQMKQAMVGQGFYYDPGTNRLIATEAWAAPVLSYDGNINGGVLQDSFTFNGYVFEADPAFRAKAGIVAGLSGGGVVRLAWANGRYLEGRLRAEAVWSPEHRIGRSNAELGLCSRNHLTGWSFLDLCHTLSNAERELASTTSEETALAVTQLFQTAAAYHEVTAELAQVQYEGADQPMLTLSWAMIRDGAATSLSLTRAAPIAETTALQARISGQVQWLWRGRALGLGLWHQTADGGAFLGSPRKDRATGISLSYELRPGLTAQLGYSVNRSTAALFDYDQLTLNARFDALRW